MEPERWVKICWNEIKREVKNNKETDWGGGMRKRLAKLGTDWRGIMTKEEGEMIQEMKNIYGTNDTGRSWARVESSKRLKTEK